MEQVDVGETSDRVPSLEKYMFPRQGLNYLKKEWNVPSFPLEKTLSITEATSCWLSKVSVFVKLELELLVYQILHRM